MGGDERLTSAGQAGGKGFRSTENCITIVYLSMSKLAHVSCVGQDALPSAQARLAATQRLYGSFMIGHLGLS